MFNPIQFYEAGKARSGTALIPFFDSTSVAFGISTRNGNTVVDWGDGSSTNIAPVKMRDYADGSALSSNFNKSYSSALNGNVSVKFLHGLKDVYSIYLGVLHATNQKSKLNILDVETFFHQFPNLFSLYIEEYAYQTTALMSVIKGDLAKLPNSVENVRINQAEILNAATDFTLNFSSYTNLSNLKFFRFQDTIATTAQSTIKVIGDLGKLPTSCQHLYLQKVSSGSAITYTAGKVWASSFDTLRLPIALTPTENDNLLIDAFNSIITAVGNKSFILPGYRTSVSDIAVAGLTAIGYNVECERKRVILDLPFQNNFTDYSSGAINVVAANGNGLPSFISDGSGSYAVTFTGNKSLKTGTNFPINNTNSVTFDFMYKSSGAASQFIIELNSAWDTGSTFLILDGNGSNFSVGDHNTSFVFGNSVRPATGVWTRITAVIDREAGVKSIKVYHNKVLKSTTSTSNVGKFSSANLFIGARNGASGFVTGQMQYLKIYNYPLSAGEITTL